MPFMKINGLKTYYESKGKGEAIVFIHCPVHPSDVYRPELEELSSDYHVISMDIRGHGRTASSPDPWDFSDIANDLKELLGRLGIEKAWLCGYSAGCSIAFEFTFKYPGAVKGLIQLGPVPKVEDGLLYFIVKNGIRLSLIDKPALFLAFFGAIINTNDWQRFLSLLKASLPTNGLDASQFYHAFLHYDCTKRLPSIKVPVLLVYGEKDRITGKYALPMKGFLPDSTLIFIKKCGHEIPLKRSVELNLRIKEFIS
ncbi:alpha/beta fold hydrolase [Thalassobacillus sp. C254]|uniref:alpha/beta fold hydrolase n=1 Tax=Thalassobacillus sp. C254 TaxID=1225341 RepID=UPI0006CFFBBA|nr:alpha/beta hydrolase [Thalassobacillus sp. C254]